MAGPSPFTPVRKLFLKLKSKHRRQDHHDGQYTPPSIALQSTDPSSPDTIIVTSLSSLPFCCHADLLSMSREQLITAAFCLNAKLPSALHIDVSHTRPDSFIRNSIEVVVGIRRDIPKAPKAVRSGLESQSGDHFDIGIAMDETPPTSPLVAKRSRSHSYDLYASLGSPRLERLEEEDNEDEDMDLASSSKPAVLGNHDTNKNANVNLRPLKKRKFASMPLAISTLSARMKPEPLTDLNVTPSPPHPPCTRSMAGSGSFSGQYASVSPTPTRVLRSQSGNISSYRVQGGGPSLPIDRPIFAYNENKPSTTRSKSLNVKFTEEPSMPRHAFVTTTRPKYRYKIKSKSRASELSTQDKSAIDPNDISDSSLSDTWNPSEFQSPRAPPLSRRHSEPMASLMAWSQSTTKAGSSKHARYESHFVEHLDSDSPDHILLDEPERSYFSSPSPSPSPSPSECEPGSESGSGSDTETETETETGVVSWTPAPPSSVVPSSPSPSPSPSPSSSVSVESISTITAPPSFQSTSTSTVWSPISIGSTDLPTSSSSLVSSALGTPTPASEGIRARSTSTASTPSEAAEFERSILGSTSSRSQSSSWSPISIDSVPDISTNSSSFSSSAVSGTSPMPVTPTPRSGTTFNTYSYPYALILNSQSPPSSAGPESESEPSTPVSSGSAPSAPMSVVSVFSAESSTPPLPTSRSMSTISITSSPMITCTSTPINLDQCQWSPARVSMASVTSGCSEIGNKSGSDMDISWGGNLKSEMGSDMDISMG